MIFVRCWCLPLMMLMAMPACGHPITSHQTFNSFELFTVADTLMAPEWVTVRVDSLNLGWEGAYNGKYHGVAKVPCDSSGVRPAALSWLPDCNWWVHDWVYSPESFVTEAGLPTLPDGETWTERGRERICRVCLRHEWQAQKRVLPRPVLAPFDSLKARLQRRPEETMMDTTDWIMIPVAVDSTWLRR